MPSSEALQRAAQAWCTDQTSHIEMDSKLAEAFAGILDEEWADAENNIDSVIMEMGDHGDG